MNIASATIQAISEYLNEDARALWSGLTVGVNSSATWLASGTQANACQLAAFGDQMLGRAADLSHTLLTLSEGVGTPVERATLQDARSGFQTILTALGPQVRPRWKQPVHWVRRRPGKQW